MDTDAGGTATNPGAAAPAAPAGAPGRAAPPRRRPRLAADLLLLGMVGVLLVTAVIAASASLYREFYSPTAFVERYLGMLADGSAADALAVPGVAVDSAQLEAAGLPAAASDALLRRNALATLTDIEIVSEETRADGVVLVTVQYRAGAYPGTTTFEVQPVDALGLPTWRFATSPLALMDLSVQGSMTFDVNGFTIDKRQISPDGVEADPQAPMSLLVFSPGIYSVSVDTAISATRGVAVLSDSPFARVPVDVQAQATPEFVQIVQEKVEEFLSGCATQDVLQPTGCPFGFIVQDRIVSPPTWSIAAQPTVTVVPDGAGWAIPAADAVAHIEVEIRSLFDGSVRDVAEDVPFVVTGTITVQPDGSASITVTAPGTP
ncbi:MULTISPECIES: hypothetical protein [unclassified Microbacterium]|uniref:hypothetical protein n=1 Tax=unclassified Microbacterium TaxID=2609290 RepID=UPI00214BA4DD|nr:MULTISPECIES: hypothetical protein [unclassified Microbacterium]MCR2808360.1 hypothetical protein [Microbacterium sp. zg.B185]WIM19192.1 hypothetical protein QNO12_16710 [Microbacterium sp. zg-B185]